jgi:hypothetical protein
VPKLLGARAPENAEVERKIRKLAGSRHAPGDWILRARIISRGWQGLRAAKIAEQRGCHPKTVRKRLHRSNAEGMEPLEGLGWCRTPSVRVRARPTCTSRRCLCAR